MSDPITSFKGAYAFLSNFYTVHIVAWNGQTCMSVEHAYQAEKMIVDADRTIVLMAPSPAAAKRIARSLPRRKDWEEIKDRVMHYYVHQKFKNNAYLRNLLLATGDRYLIEGNNWGDIYWGAEWRIDQWYGQNKLGKILMEVRREFAA